MKRIIYLLLFAICVQPNAFAQIEVSYEELLTMPEAVSNQAFAAFTHNDDLRIATFGGIDQTKVYDGIHNRCYMYLMASNIWVPIPDLPSEEGRIANGASVVKNKVIVIGGYEVFQSGNEKSLDDVDIFDPATNEFTTASPIPVPIDDHVQAVYKDSLVYIVSGWSDTGNVPDVQIYDPANDNWQTGTPVPNNNLYKGFGLAGAIVGDTLYYIGGADFSFLPNQLRKGYIHPEDPSIIDWSIEENDLASVYRPGVATWQNKVVWFGGSYDSYNYDGISYADNLGVEASGDLTIYDPATGDLQRLENVLPAIMDQRGVAKIGEHDFVICGGMLEEQEVSNKTYRITLSELSSSIESIEQFERVYPNPVQDVLNLANFNPESQYELRDLQGRIMPLQFSEKTQVAALAVGTYLLFEDEKMIARFVKD